MPCESHPVRLGAGLAQSQSGSGFSMELYSLQYMLQQPKASQCDCRSFCELNRSWGSFEAMCKVNCSLGFVDWSPQQLLIVKKITPR